MKIIRFSLIIIELIEDLSQNFNLFTISNIRCRRASHSQDQALTLRLRTAIELPSGCKQSATQLIINGGLRLRFDSKQGFFLQFEHQSGNTTQISQSNFVHKFLI